jgi:hypothetical protein
MQKFLKIMAVIVFLIAVAAVVVFYQKNSTNKSAGEYVSEHQIQEGALCETTYKGDIIVGNHIEMVLSCDHSRLDIKGAITQTIRAVDVPEEAWGYMVYEKELVASNAIGSGGVGVRVRTDYNSDGYNDIAMMSNSGSQVTGYLIFLFDPISQRFVFNLKASKSASRQ